jgi:biotin synthase
MELEQILNNCELSKEEIIYLLELKDSGAIARLFEKADEVRKEHCGDEVHLRGIIEISNYCEEDCLYCCIRKDNEELERYRMQPEEIINTAKIISNIGIGTIILQSGQDMAFNADKIAYIIYSIKQEAEVAIALSLGEREYEEYKTWRYAGADKYYLKHETNNSQINSVFHRQRDTRENIKHIESLKSLGFRVGVGTLIGLPYQTYENIAENLLYFKQLEIDLASFSTFIPSKGTPYWNEPAGSLDLTLKTIAIGRILLKNINIPATTAIAAIDPSGREKALRVGANVIFPNFTPNNYTAKYNVYRKKQNLLNSPINDKGEIQELLASLGRKISWADSDSSPKKQ